MEMTQERTQKQTKRKARTLLLLNTYPPLTPADTERVQKEVAQTLYNHVLRKDFPAM